MHGSKKSNVRLAQRMYDGGYMTLYGHSQGVTSVSFSPDGTRIASSSNDHSVILWDARIGFEIVSLKGHRGPVTSLANSPDGSRLATISEDHAMKIWDSSNGQEFLTLILRFAKEVDDAFATTLSANSEPE